MPFLQEAVCRRGGGRRDYSCITRVHMLTLVCTPYTRSHTLMSTTHSHRHILMLFQAQTASKEAHPDSGEHPPAQCPSGLSPLHPAAHGGGTPFIQTTGCSRDQQHVGATPDTHRHMLTEHLPADSSVELMSSGHPPRLVLLDTWPHLTSRLITGWKTNGLKLLPVSFPSNHVSHCMSTEQDSSCQRVTCFRRDLFLTSYRTVVSGKLGTQGKHTAQSRPSAESLKYFFLKKNVGKLVKIFTLIFISLSWFDLLFSFWSICFSEMQNKSVSI